MHFLLGLILTTLALFLIMIILVQRGRGGGLSGALGGMGGQSAFGTKAGDAFTKITVGMSIAWIVMCIITSLALGRGKSVFESSSVLPGGTTPAATGAGPETTSPAADALMGSDAEVSTEGGVLGEPGATSDPADTTQSSTATPSSNP
jgi:preprotein translocase subunit SecG